MGKFLDEFTSYKGFVPLHETVAVLNYNAGEMLKASMYLKWFGADEKEAAVRKGYLKSGLMAVIAQAELVCEKLGISFDEMREMGKEDVIETISGYWEKK